MDLSLTQMLSVAFADNNNRHRGRSFSKRQKGHGPPSNRSTPGFRIRPDFSKNVVIGEKAKFSGTICYYKKHPVFEDKPSCREFDEDNRDHKVRFFYPDLSTEVTSKVTLKGTEKGMAYEFESEKIENTSPKNFYAFVHKEKSRLHEWFHSQEKLRRYVAIIERRLKYVRHDFVRKKLIELKNILQRAQEEVGHRLRESEDTLAQLKMPLQVGNKISGKMEKSAVFGDIRISLASESAQVIEGERTKYLSTVTRLDGDKRDKRRPWKFNIAYSFKGEEIENKSDLELSKGQEVQFEHLTNGLFKGESTDFNVTVHRTKDLPRQAASFDMFQNWERGNLNIKSFVHKDPIAPSWEKVSLEKSEVYTNDLENFNAEVFDTFGRVDRSSLSLLLAGTKASGESYTEELISELAVVAKEEKLPLEKGSSRYSIEGEISQLPEGSFTLKGLAKDFAENEGVFERTLHIDRTPPKVTLNKEDGTLTNEPKFDLPVSIADASPVSVKVFHNQELIYEGSEKDFSAQATLSEGENTFQVLATDRAGNEGDPKTLESVTLDTIPPEIAIDSPVDGKLVNITNSLSLAGSSNEELEKITANGAPLSLDALEFSDNVAVSNNTRATLRVSAFDLAGNETQKIIEVPFNIAPEAKLSLSKEIVTLENAVTLDASSSSDREGNIAEYIFELGNGETIVQSNPTLEHVYKNSGTYNVKVTVKDELGLEGASESKELKINAPPVAKMSVPEEVKTTKGAEFSASESSDSDGSISSYEWEMGDGSTLDGENIAHTYAEAGTYDVTLTVVDDNGAKNSISRSLEVIEPHLSPAPDFAFSVDRGKVEFDASASLKDGRQVESYEWEFGDSKSATELDPQTSHTYDETRAFEVTLTVTDERGESASVTKEVPVSTLPKNIKPRAEFFYYVNNPFEVQVQAYEGASFDPDGKIVSYKVDYGDGTVEKHRAPIFKHTYDSPGEYEITLEVTDNQGAKATKTRTLNLLDSGAAPVADFQCYLRGGFDYGCEGVNSYSTDSYLKDAVWETRKDSQRVHRHIHEAGETGRLAREDIRYYRQVSEEGIYDISLTVTDGEGNKTTKTKELQIKENNSAPIGEFSCYPSGNLAITCQSYHSRDPDGQIRSQEWWLGDYFYWDKNRVEQTFKEPGTKTIYYGVTDMAGKKQWSSIEVEVKERDSNLPPVADFYCQDTGERTLSCEALFSYDPDGEIADIEWDFGDESSANGYALSHQYDAQGTYNVELTVTDNEGKTSSYTQSYSVGDVSNEIPVIVFNCDRDGDKAVECSVEGSYDIDGEIVGIDWDMGDGTSYTDKETVSHVYDEVDTFDIIATLTDDDGHTSSHTHVFVNPNEPPKPAFNLTKSQLLTGEKVGFDAEATYDPDGEIASYEWFVDGNQVGSGEFYEHTFQSSGFYTVRLVATDNDGANASFERNASVKRPLEVDMIVGQYSGNPFESIDFEAMVSSPNGGIESIEWDFGDGSTSQENPTEHLYRDYGSYTVSVKVTDGSGQVAETEKSIEIDNYDADLEPTAAFQFDVNHESKTVELDASNSLRHDARVDEYVWEIESRDENLVGENPKATHTFPDFGSYPVTLTVKNSAGQGQITKEISIYDMPVPDPGEDGRMDFAGVDSDGDGLRDDVQRRAIILAEGDENELYEVLKKFAKKNIKNAKNATDVEKSIERTRESIDLERCIVSKMGDTRDTYEKVQLLKVQMFNTKERLLAWGQTRINFSGQIVDAVDPNTYGDYCPSN